MSNFSPNCTLPPNGNNYVSGSPVRGTLDILWSCLSVILLSTWSTLHLNIPPQSKPRNRRESFKRNYYRVRDKLQWMILSVIAPEIPLAKAMVDFMATRRSTKELKKWANQDGVEWSMAHSYLVDMGGVMFTFADKDEIDEAGVVEASGNAPGRGADEARVANGSGTRKDSNMEQQSTANIQHHPITDLRCQSVINIQDKSTGEVPDRQAPDVHHRSTRTMVDTVTSGDHPSADASSATNMSIGKRELSGISQSAPSEVRPTNETKESTRQHSFARAERTGNGDATSIAEKSDTKVSFANDDSISVYMKDGIWASPDAFLEYIEEGFMLLDNRIGTTIWQRNDKNQSLVRDAFRIFQSLILNPSSSELSTFEKDQGVLGLLDTRYSRQVWRMGAAHLQGKLWILTCEQLIYAREIGIINRLPDISEDQIDSQNQSDALVKLIAILQALWLIIDILVRASRHQPISQLEILAVAFSANAAMTYSFLWYKPKEISLPLFFPVSRYASSHEIVVLSGLAPGIWQTVKRMPFFMRNAAYARGKDVINANSFAWVTVGSIIFGALHCPAWDFEFPTSIERDLWRASAVATMVCPFFFGVVRTWLSALLTLFVGGRVTDKWLEYRVAQYAWESIRLVAFLIYSGARIFIIVEIFRSLFYLPPEAFSTTDWDNVFRIG